MTATVTLRWQDPESASDFLRIREEYNRDGWLTDTAVAALQELVGEAEVVKDSSDEEGEGGSADA